MSSDFMLLDNLPVEFDLKTIAEQQHMKPGSAGEAVLANLIEEAKEIARPKAAYKACAPERQKDNLVKLDGIVFTSRLLWEKLEDQPLAFPYIATCGQEMNKWAAGYTDMLENYLADALMLAAMRQVRNHIEEIIKQKYSLKQISRMGPGSLPKEWPIDEQIPLFNLMDSMTDTLGVKLTPSLLMMPSKSVSGIYFATEEEYHNCQLCPRDDCPERRAPYDAILAEQRRLEQDQETSH